MNPNTYDEAVQSYMWQFRELKEMPTQPETAVRGAGGIPADVLVSKAEAIADISRKMIPLADEYFTADSPAVREEIRSQFLAQATAEMQMAVELLQVVEDTDEAKPTTRAVRGDQLQTVINDLEQVMAAPLTTDTITKSTRAATSTTIPKAKAALEEKVSVSLLAISKQVQDLGGDIAYHLVFQSEWAAVIEGVSMANKDIAELLDKVRKGVGGLLKRAIAVASKTLLNVYDKILALLGKDLESVARQTTKQWLEQIKEKADDTLFDELLRKLYGIDKLKKELPTWLQVTQADLATLNDTTNAVINAADKFITLTGRAETLAGILVMAKAIKMPQILAIIAGLQVALLSVVVYTGYDYVGYSESRLPNFVQGIGEIVKLNLNP